MRPAFGGILRCPSFAGCGVPGGFETMGRARHNLRSKRPRLDLAVGWRLPTPTENERATP